MLIFNDLKVDADVDTIMTTLKDYLAERDIKLFDTMKITNGNLMLTCPFHNGGHERRASAGISLDGGIFHCFTCHEAMALPLLISKVCGLEDGGAFGKKWLEENFGASKFYNRTPLKCELFKKEIPIEKEYITEQELSKYRFYHPYMWKRHLTKEIVEMFDIGYDPDFIMKSKKEDGTEEQYHVGECITFPVRDEFGNCVFVARRSVKTKFFHYPKDCEKPVYALDKILRENITEVVVCESFFNALSCWSWGIPAIALMGTGDDKQYEILRHSSIRKYRLAFDGDFAGHKAVRRFQDAMSKYAVLTYIEIPNGKDVNDLTYEEFINLHEENLIKKNQIPL